MIYKDSIIKRIIIYFIAIAYIAIYSIYTEMDFKFTLFYTAIGIIVVCVIETKIVKRADRLRNKIIKVRNIICEGPACIRFGLRTIRGWLFLSEDALEFYTYKESLSKKNTAILIDDIISVDISFNKLIIKTNDKSFTIKVNKANLWKQDIEKIL